MRTAADLDPYVGIPYDARRMDCADLVLLVRERMFGQPCALAGHRPRPLHDDAQALAIGAALGKVAVRTELPQDGDLVLMYSPGQEQPGHVGTWFLLDYEPWVLHCSNALGASRLHRMRELSGLGLRVEGVYRWM